MRKRGILLFTAILFSLASFVSATIVAAEGMELDLVTHNSVIINAPPAAIWPKILDPSEWKAGPRLIAIEGTPDQPSAKFKAVMPDTPDQVAFYSQNVEVIPERRRAMRLNSTEGTLMGFAIWELAPEGGGTRVEYHVYSQIVVPEAALAGMSEADRAVYRTDYVPSNFKRFQSELETLKRLIEKPGT